MLFVVIQNKFHIFAEPILAESPVRGKARVGTYT